METLLLFSIYVSMAKAQIFQCLQINHPRDPKAIALYNQYGLPLDALEVNSNKEINYLKSYKQGEIKGGKQFYTLRYSAKDEVVSSQFSFHRQLYERIKSEPFCLYQMICFTNAAWNYITYIERIPSHSLEKIHDNSDILKLEKVFKEMLTVFVKIESNNGVFARFMDEEWRVSSTGAVQLFPPCLAHIYEAEKICYVNTQEWFSPNRNPELEPIERKHTENFKFISLKASKVWNAYFFLHLMGQYLEKFTHENLEERNNILRGFRDQTEALAYFVRRNKEVDFDMEKLIEFTHNLGRMGSLSELARQRLPHYHKAFEEYSPQNKIVGDLLDRQPDFVHQVK